jgi:hypothetical protein
VRLSNLLRIAATAVALSTISFAAGVAGDLSEPPRSGVRVVMRIPPEIPADAIRAAPLPPRLVATSTAEASRPLRRRADFEPLMLARAQPFRLIEASHQGDELKPLAKPASYSSFAPRKDRAWLANPERRKGGNLTAA